MDSNALYYTLSTAAQTLGGAIALLGAFVFYRLQGVNAEIAHVVTQQILQFSGKEQPKLEELHLLGQYEEFLSHARAHLYAEHLRVPGARLERLVKSKRSLVGGFRFSLWLTVITSIIAVASLAFVPSISACRWVAVGVLTVVVVAFVACLLSYARILTRSLT